MNKLLEYKSLAPYALFLGIISALQALEVDSSFATIAFNVFSIWCFIVFCNELPKHFDKND